MVHFSVKDLSGEVPVRHRDTFFRSSRLMVRGS